MVVSQLLCNPAEYVQNTDGYGPHFWLTNTSSEPCGAPLVDIHQQLPQAVWMHVQPVRVRNGTQRGVVCITVGLAEIHTSLTIAPGCVGLGVNVPAWTGGVDMEQSWTKLIFLP